MKKKNRKPAAETLVKSILEDLQKDVGDSDSSSDSDHASENQSPDAELGLFGGGKKGTGRPLVGSNDDRSLSREYPDGLDPDENGGSDEDENPLFAELREKPKKKKHAPVVSSPSSSSEDRTVSIQETAPIHGKEDSNSITFRSSSFHDRTIPMARHSVPESGMKVSHGISRPLTKNSASLAASVTEAQMLQAENLRMAQSRILDLEKEVESLRQENELLASAGEIAKQRAEELYDKVQEIDRMKVDALEQAQAEISIYRENLGEKDRHLSKMRQKIEDLETRLAKDLKKIRVRERELENRLELSKMEKTALVRAKDDAILDLKAKVDQVYSELESYKARCAELNMRVDGQHDQLSRTVRALRLALAHLEANDSAGNLTPLKKAE